MKKKYIILTVVIILILLVAAAGLAYYIINENAKEYEVEKVEEYNYFVLKQNNLYGVIDKNGNTIINAEYDEVKLPNPQKAVFICYKEGNTTVFNEKNEQILAQYQNLEPLRFKNISSSLMYEKSVLKYQQDGKYGIINFEGKQLTKPIYDEIDTLQYKEGELLIKQNDKYGVININGKQLVKPEYDEIQIDEYYEENSNYKNSGYIVGIKTEEGYRYGYINNKGNQILEPEYNDITRVKEIHNNDNAFLICAKNGQYGLNKNEQNIIGNEYQSIRYDETNKVFVIEKSKKYGIANNEGSIILPVEYSQIDITGNYLYAKKDQEVKVYNSDGTQADIEPDVEILNTSNEKYKIKINGKDNQTKYGVIDEKGEQLIPENYNYISYLFDNYFMASYENGKLGVLDDKGQVKIELNNDSLQQIQGSKLIQTTKLENKDICLYSETLEKICEMQDATLKVENDYIKLYNNTEVKYFDKQGKELQNTQVYPDNKLFVKVQNNKYGFVDNQGNVIIDYKYDKAYEFNEYGFAAVKKDDKWGAVNEQGQEIVAPSYIFEEQVEPIFIGQYYRVIYGFGEYYFTNDAR